MGSFSSSPRYALSGVLSSLLFEFTFHRILKLNKSLMNHEQLFAAPVQNGPRRSDRNRPKSRGNGGAIGATDTTPVTPDPTQGNPGPTEAVVHETVPPQLNSTNDKPIPRSEMSAWTEDIN